MVVELRTNHTNAVRMLSHDTESVPAIQAAAVNTAITCTMTTKVNLEMSYEGSGGRASVSW